MAEQLTLAAEARTEFGKGAARRARAAGKIPAVLYGHGSEPIHVLLPGHETMMALKHANALFSIELGKSTEMAVAKDVQRDPVRRIIEHVDLLIVRKGEKLTVEVPIHVVGESFAGTIHVLEHGSIQVSAEATHLPEVIEVSVEGLVDGTRIHAGEIALPTGATLVSDPQTLIVAVTHPRQSAADAATDDAHAAEVLAASVAAPAASAE